MSPDYLPRRLLCCAYFLTGVIQVGKTTIIRSFLKQSGLSADGFLTHWDSSYVGGRALYLSPYAPNIHKVVRYCLAQCHGERFVKEENIEVIFDVHGTGILSSAGKLDIIIMDELGFLESKAYAFQDAVLGHIAGAVPILGVIKPKRTRFLGEIRTRPEVRVCEVTEENRNWVLEWLLTVFKPC